MSYDAKMLVAAVIAVPTAIGASYLSAIIGEPRSVWLWRDMLGLL